MPCKPIRFKLSSDLSYQTLEVKCHTFDSDSFSFGEVYLQNLGEK